MDKQPPTAGQIAARLTAKEIEPLVKYVERITDTKLSPSLSKKQPKPVETRK